MFKSQLIAIALPAIALSASLPVFADTVTRYELRSTIDGETNILQPGVVEYRRFSTSNMPSMLETRTITNSVVAPTTVRVPTSNTVRFIESPVLAPVAERRVFIDNPAPVVLERRVQSLPVFIERTAPPVLMETYDPPVVLESRYKTHYHHHHMVDVGVPLVHLRAF